MYHQPEGVPSNYDPHTTLMHSVHRNSSQNLGMSNKSGQFQNAAGPLFTNGKGYITGIGLVIPHHHGIASAT